jgi:hypothetical protein
MGEARRRKLAGSYPNPADPPDPIAAARRFWCGRDAVAASEFRTPAGTLAVTLDIEGLAPATYVFDAGRMVEVLAGVSSAASKVSYYALVQRVASDFIKAMRAGGDGEALTGIGIAALWIAMHHPQSGPALRRAVSGHLRRDGRAHITWHFAPASGLGLALAGTFVDLEDIVARAPDDRVIIATSAGDDDAGGKPT